MNVRAFDLLVRSLTSSVLAVGMLCIVAEQIVTTGTVDTAVAAMFGPVLGAFFGAHISQNGSSARSRRDAVIVAETEGREPPRDDAGLLKSPPLSHKPPP